MEPGADRLKLGMSLLRCGALGRLKHRVRSTSLRFLVGVVASPVPLLCVANVAKGRCLLLLTWSVLMLRQASLLETVSALRLVVFLVCESRLWLVSD